MSLSPSIARTCAVLTLGLLANSAPVRGQEFLEVTVQDRFFHSPENHPVLRVRTRDPVMLDVIIHEAEGRPLMFREGKEVATRHEIAFETLPPANRGLYLFRLFARANAEAPVSEYPAQVEGGDLVEVSDCRWVEETQRVEYFLPRAACLRIRAGLAESAYISEVLPWEAQPSGRHAISWKGAVENPVIREMMGRPDFQIRVLALSLPSNLLVDQRLRSARFAGDSTPSITLPDHYRDRAAMPGGSLYSHVRKRSQIAIADDYRLVLRTEATPLRGVVNLRLDCVEEDRARLLNQRYEVMVFLDGVFLMEDEVALLPFNYRMSTRGLSPGQHLVTMNVLDSQGVPGTASAFIEVPSVSSNLPGQQ